jgi:hypothetical protein
MNLFRLATTDIGTDGRNLVTAAIEREHIATGPERLFVYVKRGDPDTVIQWTGHYLGLAWIGPKARVGFNGSYRHPITARIYDHLYHGWYYASSGDYARLKLAKRQGEKYAATRGV